MQKIAVYTLVNGGMTQQNQQISHNFYSPETGS